MNRLRKQGTEPSNTNTIVTIVRQCLRFALVATKISIVALLMTACIQKEKTDDDCKEGKNSKGEECTIPTDGITDGAGIINPIQPKEIGSDRVCSVDYFKQNKEEQVVTKLDILFMMDTSGSMKDDWARVANNVQELVRKIPEKTNVRFAVMLGHTGHWKGKLFAPKKIPIVLDNTKQSTQQISQQLHKIFTEAMKIKDDSSGEALFQSLYWGSTRYLKEIQNQGFFRPDAALSVLFMSDENEIGTFPANPKDGLPVRCDEAFENEIKRKYYTNYGITPNTTYGAVKAMKGDMPVTMHAFVNLTADDVWKRNKKGSRCLYDGLGYGYFEIVKMTQGQLFSIQENRAEGMAVIGSAIKKSLTINHEFKLSQESNLIDPLTIQAAVDGKYYPYEYRPITNIVYLQYAGVAESSIEISYCEPKQLKPWAIEGFQGTAQFESVDVTWRTPDLETRSKVLWGLQGTELKNELTNDALKTQHAFSVTGLNSDTTYFFQAIGTDSAGRVKRSDIISVRTLVPNSTSTQTETFTATETVTMTATSTSTVTQTGTTTQTATTTQTETTTQTATTTQTETTTQTATTTQTETTTQTATGTETNTATGTQTATQTETQTETQTATNTSTNTGTEPPPNTTWIVQGFDGTTTGSSATLIWQTVGVNTTAEVFMGTSLSNLAPAANVQDPSETHLILVGGLTPSTTYFFQVRARDAHGRIVDSSIISKRTKAQ